MTELLRRNPFLYLLGGLLAGIAAAMNFGGGWWLAGTSMLCGAIIYLFLRLKARSPLLAVKLAPYHCLWAALCATGLGAATATLHAPEIPDYDILAAAPVATAIVEEASQRTDAARMTARIESLSGPDGKPVCSPNNIRIIIISDSIFRPGSRIAFLHEFRPPEPNPNVQCDNSLSYLRGKGIIYSQRLSGNKVTTLTEENDYCWVDELRHRCTVILDKSMLADSPKAFVATLTLGDRSSFMPDDLDQFRLAGISHILAVSGMHIGVLAMLLTAFLSPLYFIIPPRGRQVAVIILLWCYAFITGLQTAALRACVMATLCFGAIAVQRRYSSLNALLAAAFIILLFDPKQLSTPGFQLSFAAAGTLILSAGLNPIERHEHRNLWRLAQAIICTLTALAGTLALGAWHFHTLPLASVAPNLSIMWLMPVYLSVALIYEGLLVCGMDVEPLRWILERGYDMLLYISINTAHSAYTLRGIWIHGAVPFLTLALVGSLLIWIKSLDRRAAVSTVICTTALICALIWLPVQRPADGFIVQQGLADRILVYENGESYSVTLSAGTVGVHKTGDSRIGWVLANTDSIPFCHYLLIGKGFQGHLPEETFTSVVLLPSLDDYTRRKITETCLKSDTPCHDIREMGPLRVLAKE